MYATVRRTKCKPGKVDAVADLIEKEYIPKLGDLDGVISYTVVQSGHDEVSCLGIFTSETGAIAADGLAVLWLNDRLKHLGGPVEALDGPVLVYAAAPS
jgi:hypothetical protein